MKGKPISNATTKLIELSTVNKTIGALGFVPCKMREVVRELIIETSVNIEKHKTCTCERNVKGNIKKPNAVCAATKCKAKRLENEIIGELQKNLIYGVQEILKQREMDTKLYHEFMLEIPTESETGPPKKRGRKKKVGEESPADDEEREEREKEHQQAYKYRKGGYSEKKYRSGPI